MDNQRERITFEMEKETKSSLDLQTTKLSRSRKKLESLILVKVKREDTKSKVDQD